MTAYSEFRLRIDRGQTAGTYRVVATGPSGEALGRFKLPFSDMELENFVLKVGRTRQGQAPARVARDGARQGLRQPAVRRRCSKVTSRSSIRSSFIGRPGRGQWPADHPVADRRARAEPDPVGVPVRPSELPVDLDMDADRALPGSPQAEAAAPDHVAAADPRRRQRPTDARADRRRAEKAKLGQALAPLVESGCASPSTGWRRRTCRALQRQLAQGRLPRLPLHRPRRLRPRGRRRGAAVRGRGRPRPTDHRRPARARSCTTRSRSGWPC